MSIKECLSYTSLTVLSDRPYIPTIIQEVRQTREGHIAVCPITLLNQALYSKKAAFIPYLKIPM